MRTAQSIRLRARVHVRVRVCERAGDRDKPSSAKALSASDLDLGWEHLASAWQLRFHGASAPETLLTRDDLGFARDTRGFEFAPSGCDHEPRYGPEHRYPPGPAIVDAYLRSPDLSRSSAGAQLPPPAPRVVQVQAQAPAQDQVSIFNNAPFPLTGEEVWVHCASLRFQTAAFEPDAPVSAEARRRPADASSASVTAPPSCRAQRCTLRTCAQCSILQLAARRAASGCRARTL